METVKIFSGSGRKQTKLLMFHENEASTGTRLLKSSQSKFIVNEIVGIVLDCITEVHLGRVTEEFLVVDENGEDIEDI